MSSDTTTVTLHDEATRRAVEYALWDHASIIVGVELLSEELRDAARQVATVDIIENGQVPASERADERLAALTAVRANIEHVREAQVGETLALSMQPDELCRQLDDCRTAVEDLADPVDSGAFFDREPKVRDLAMSTRDAAVRLLLELGARERVA